MPWKGSPELLVAAAPAVRPAEDLWLASASSFVLEGNVYSSSLREQLGWAAAVPVRAIAAQLRACSEAHDVEAGGVNCAKDGAMCGDRFAIRSYPTVRLINRLHATQQEDHNTLGPYR